MTNRARRGIAYRRHRAQDMLVRVRRRRPLHFRLWFLGLAFMAALGIVLLAASSAHAPASLSVGAQAKVANVGARELNIRHRPGVAGSQVLFRAAEGSILNIIGGPQPADGLTWWRIQDPFSQLDGWAAANYLQAYQAETGSSQ